MVKESFPTLHIYMTNFSEKTPTLFSFIFSAVVIIV